MNKCNQMAYQPSATVNTLFSLVCYLAQTTHLRTDIQSIALSIEVNLIVQSTWTGLQFACIREHSWNCAKLIFFQKDIMTGYRGKMIACRMCQSPVSTLNEYSVRKYGDHYHIQTLHNVCWFFILALTLASMTFTKFCFHFRRANKHDVDVLWLKLNQPFKTIKWQFHSQCVNYELSAKRPIASSHEG